ncbi:MAG: protein kinase domain-containing protein [Eggerthellaceae bacterium]
MLSDASISRGVRFQCESTAYLIMEYVEGVTLTELLHRHADRLTLDVVAAVFASVSHALEVAHANQVLHLDIKPDNVLINHQGQVKSPTSAWPRWPTRPATARLAVAPSGTCPWSRCARRTSTCAATNGRWRR